MTALLLSLLVLAQAFSALALQKSANIPMDTLNYVESAAAVNGKLYLSGYDTIHEWDGETGELTRFTLAQGTDVYPNIVAWGDALYSIDLAAGTLRELQIAGAEIKAGAGVAFDNKGLRNQDGGYEVIHTAVCLGDKLYLLTSAEDEGEDARELHEVDLQTGKCAALLSGTNLSAMCGYKDGNLLIKVFDRMRYHMGGQYEEDLPAFTVYDTAQRKWAQTVLRAEEPDAVGAAYDEKTDTLYMVSGRQLYAKTASGELEPVNYISSESTNDTVKALLIGSAQYVLIEYTGIFVRSTDKNDRISDTLRVTGYDFSYYGTEGYQAFVKAHPEIAVVTSGNAPLETAEAFYQDFLSSTAADVYVVSDGSILEALINKGYCMDISASGKLSQAAQSMYPQMAQAFYRDGKVYGVPLFISQPSVFGYSPSLFEKIGIAKEDVPSTIEELMDFIVQWVDVYAAENPGLDLFMHKVGTYRRMLINYIYGQQVAYCYSQGIPVTFDTPEMRLLLNKLDEITPALTALDSELRADGDRYMDDPLVALIDQMYRVFDAYRSVNMDHEPMSVSLADGIPMLHTVNMYTLIVNPNTKHKEAAIALLESLVDNLDAETAYMLFSDLNEPKEDPYYTQDKQLHEKSIKQIDEQLAKETDEAFIRLLQESRENSLKMLEELEATRYLILPKDIANYRAIAPNVLPASGGYNTLYQGETLQTLQKRFLENQITAEQFITETEKILQMMYLENK